MNALSKQKVDSRSTSVKPGYKGICACCLEPILGGVIMCFRKRGRKFHAACVARNPANYYVRRELQLALRQAKSKKAPAKADLEIENGIMANL